MIYLVSGLFFLLFPFLLCGLFEDKKVGFVYVLFFSIIFQAFLALITQAFGIFNYGVILSVNILAVSVTTWFLFNKKEKFKIFRVDPVRSRPPEHGSATVTLGRLASNGVDWMLVFVILIALISLAQVHYDYTGKISLAPDQGIMYHDVKNMFYPYPYYSDEWDAVSFINYSIDSHSLPFKNPLDNSSYINFAAPFFSFLSGTMLLLKTNPLLSFNFFSIFINTLIVIVSYIFLRINKISKLASGVSALFLLYIPATANLPGIWHLIPIHMGILFALLGFCFISLKKTGMAALSAFMVLIFYPPLILFYGLGFLVFLFSEFYAKNLKFSKNFYVSISALAVLLLFFAMFAFKNFSGISNAIISRLYFPSFSGEYIPQFHFYNIIPTLSFFFFLFSIRYILKNYKWLISQIILGAGFWILYSFIAHRIIIDYERIVFFTSIILVLASGFGFQAVLNYISAKPIALKYPIYDFLTAFFVVLFLISTFFYTSQNHWQKFILINPRDGLKGSPRAPANRYLLPGDLKLFEGISHKNFLSIPWKGLVIGVATGNYPAVSKEGIISVGNGETVDQFIKAGCAEKLNIAKTQKLDYIYLNDFKCNGFEKIGQTGEGFVLFKVI